MQGCWVRVSYSIGGIKRGAGAGNIRIVGQKLSFYLGDRLRDEWSISVKPNKTFEAKIIFGDLKGRRVSGIYHQQGDVLTLSYPVTFQQGLLGAPEQVLIVLTYKRKKP
jgi:hypothetical protein